MNIDEIILNALREDIGTGDITTLSTIPPDKLARGRFIAKEAGVICGLEVCGRVFGLLDASTEFKASKADGGKADAGEIIAEIAGNARSLLTGERTAVNILQRMSGIATLTAGFAAQVAGTRAKIADTRKTCPGMRVLDKYAVKAGGGINHRFSLADGILIKDNHIAAAGGIRQAVASARANAPFTLKIEVECQSMGDVREAVGAGADIIMLDNMRAADMKECVDYIAGRALVEASGNMDAKDLREVAAAGVDIISIGALTHSVRILDISLDLFQS